MYDIVKLVIQSDLVTSVHSNSRRKRPSTDGIVPTEPWSRHYYVSLGLNRLKQLRLNLHNRGNFPGCLIKVKFMWMCCWRCLQNFKSQKLVVLYQDTKAVGNAISQYCKWILHVFFFSSMLSYFITKIAQWDYFKEAPKSGFHFIVHKRSNRNNTTVNMKMRHVCVLNLPKHKMNAYFSTVLWLF